MTPSASEYERQQRLEETEEGWGHPIPSGEQLLQFTVALWETGSQSSDQFNPLDFNTVTQWCDKLAAINQWLNLYFEMCFGVTTNSFGKKKDDNLSFLKSNFVILIYVKLWNQRSLVLIVYDTKGKWWTLMRTNMRILDVCEWGLKDYFLHSFVYVVMFVYSVSSYLISLDTIIISCDFLSADYLQPPN